MGEMPRFAANSVNPQSGLRAKVNKALTWCMFTSLTFAAIAAFGQLSAVMSSVLPTRPAVLTPAVPPRLVLMQTSATAIGGARATIIRAERVTFSPKIKARRSRVTGEERQLVDFE
jgi:hypothetical protein